MDYSTKTADEIVKEIRDAIKEQPPMEYITFYCTKSQMIEVCRRYEVDPTPYLEKFFND